MVYIVAWPRPKGAGQRLVIVALSAILVDQLVAGVLSEQMVMWHRSIGKICLTTKCSSAEYILVNVFEIIMSIS
jgi:hypothetical protein